MQSTERHRRITAAAIGIVLAGCGAQAKPRAAPATINSQVCVERSLRRSADPGMVALVFGEFTKACDAGEASACSSLGVMYEIGLGTAEDHVRAGQLYKSACAAQNIGGCTNLGLAYLHGFGVTADSQRARQLLEWSCKFKHPVACRELGAMHLVGEGVDVSADAAVRYFRLGCKYADGEACFNLGMLFEQGVSQRQDTAQAIGYYEQACVQGEARACDGLLRIQRQSDTAIKVRDEVKPLPSERACDSGDGAECAAAGLAYFRGDGVKRDVERSVALMQRACSSGYDASCKVLGPMLQGSCSHGHGDACAALQKLDASGIDLGQAAKP